MKNVEIKYSQLLFFYAYLRLIDLSLDRSRWTTWNELQLYFKKNKAPDKVIHYVKNSFYLSETDLTRTIILCERNIVARKLKFVFCKNFMLSKDEILYCCKLLLNFEKILKTDFENYNLEIEKLRIDIAEYYNKVLGTVILNRDLKKLMKIEHFEQNDKIEVVKLKEFIPYDFLQIK